ncbi:Protein FLOWERING LOCUS T [Lachnellula cervina]|uniref:Protein FLOWERING LOCUS T n=1 Tax=Lachnellula cervina TaxID=1316786 RepID=A0A7D8UMK5_9HELO|nr:Protein FLOWERING LOCUS T [Lachnellula cervina]
MRSSTSITSTIALAGIVTAFTPVGFQPASTNNLTVAFGNTLATNGVNLPKAETQTAPTIGTSQPLFGSYTLMMVDPDIPPQIAGGATSELLHWLQPGLVSANTSTTIGGLKVYELINPTNVSAIATYISPSPPNKSPTTHRYTQLLLNTTGNGTALSTLSKAGATRSNFSAVDVVRNAGLNVLFGNYFNVSAATNTTGSGTGNGTSSGASSSGSGGKATGGASAVTTTRLTTVPGSTATAAAGAGSDGNSTGAAKSTAGVGAKGAGSGAILAGLGAMAAAVILL